MTRVSMMALLLAVFARASAGQGVAIADSLFQPITLPPTISFGYPANTIFVPRIHELARARNFDALEAMFAQLAADVAADVKHESRYGDAFDAFARNDPALLGALTAWIEARPQSAHAFIARANYHFAAAWRRRGQRAIGNTPQQNLRGMRESSEKAIEDAAAALARDTTQLGAYEIVIGVSQFFGEIDVAFRALTRGLAIHPGSFRLHYAFIHMLWPQWGGAEDLVRRYAERAAQSAAVNPRLATLRGAVHEYRSHDSAVAGNYAGAVRELNKALAFGPERTFLLRRGRAYYRLGAYEYAFHDLRTVVLEQSQHAEALQYYGLTLVQLASRARPAIRPTILDRAIESLTLAAYLLPDDASVRDALGEARRMAGR